MINTPKQLLASPKGRYLVVGAAVYLLELAIIIVLTRIGFSSVTALTSAFWSGLLISFLLQKFYTFADTRTMKKIVFSQAIAVGLLIVFNYGFTLLIAAILNAVDPAITRTIALLITTIWNFYLYKTKIFAGGATA